MKEKNICRSEAGLLSGLRARVISLLGLLLFAGLVSVASAQQTSSPYRILVLGDAFSSPNAASYSDHWVGRLQLRLEQEQHLFTIVNASSGDLSSHQARQKIDKMLQQHKPDLVVLQAGTFDASLGYTKGFTDRNLSGILASVARTGADSLMVSIIMPASMRVQKNDNSSERFRQIAEDHKAHFAEMNLTKLDRRYDLSFGDKAFIVGATQKRLMKTIWRALEENLQKDMPKKKVG